MTTIHPRIEPDKVRADPAPRHPVQSRLRPFNPKKQPHRARGPFNAALLGYFLHSNRPQSRRQRNRLKFFSG
jgi:hypothetical protein